MIRSFYIQENELHWEKNPTKFLPDGDKEIVWVDLQSPSTEEMKQVEKHFGIEFFTAQEAAEIESSSRYFEDSSGFEANSAFVVSEGAAYATRQVSFILKDDLLFTLRRADLKSFAETVRKITWFTRTAMYCGR